MANGYYNHTTYPATNAAGSSASMRSELDAITSGFSLLPSPLGSGQTGFNGGNWLNPIIQGQSGLGSIDSIPIGVNGQSSGSFTSLAASGTTTLASAVLTTADINGGTIDGTVIGAATKAAGSFTTLAATGAVNLGTGGVLAGTFTGGSFSGGTIDNTPIGATTASTGAFTSLGATGAVTLAGGGSLAGTYTGAPTFSGNPAFTGAPTYSARPSFNGNLAWDAGNLVGPLRAANNLSDVASAATARTNLAVGKTLLGTVTATGTNEVHFDGTFITSAYDDYEIEMDGVAFSSTASLCVRLSTDGVTYITTALYHWVVENVFQPVPGTASNAISGAINQTIGVVQSSIPTTATSGRVLSGTLKLRDANTAGNIKVLQTDTTYQDSGSNFIRSNGAIFAQTTSATRGIQLLSNTTLISLGTFRLYGLNK